MRIHWDGPREDFWQKIDCREDYIGPGPSSERTWSTEQLDEEELGYCGPSALRPHRHFNPYTDLEEEMMMLVRPAENDQSDIWVSRCKRIDRKKDGTMLVQIEQWWKANVTSVEGMTSCFWVPNPMDIQTSPICGSSIVFGWKHTGVHQDRVRFPKDTKNALLDHWERIRQEADDIGVIGIEVQGSRSSRARRSIMS